jgi:hypothetical protein
MDDSKLVLRTASSRVREKSGEQEGLIAREVGRLVDDLLRELSVSRSSRTRETLRQIADLRKILSTNYVEDITLPCQELLHELAEIVASFIVSRDGREWRNLSSAQLLSRLFRRLGPREIDLHARPYLHGAGLKIRGFFCRTEIRGGARFIIFVNTAHHPGAAAASLGHELGHYVYDALKGETAPTLALLEGSFAQHFDRESELFADSLVSLSAYSREVFREISRDGIDPSGVSGKEMLPSLLRVYSLLGARYSLDLKKLSNAWRIRYLASMAHFYKLRGALYSHAGV